MFRIACRNLWLLFAMLLVTQFTIAQSTFVSAEGEQFYLNGKPYYYLGTNYWYGNLLPLKKNKKKGISRLRNELDFLQSKGITNLRIIAGAEGEGLVAGIIRIGPPLQKEKGVFNPKVLWGLDVLLAEMGKRDMKAVIYLSNNWEWSGGFLQYLRWNGIITDSVFKNKMEWDDMRDIVSKFYGCEPCVADYLKQVKHVVTHTNSITQKKYINDPVIMAWELANEPRPMRPYAINDYKKFISRAAALIKSLDTNHLLTLGTEGYIGTENKEVYENIHEDKNVDYLTIHIWPKNWAWFTGKKMAPNLDTILGKTTSYIQEHTTIAEKLNKPLVIEEFGLPRDEISFDINSPTTYRDIYFKTILSKWAKSKRCNGVLAGLNFWAYGGLAKPVKGQLFWKKGDPYMGDPPMEEQGLYSVFNTDTSTWQIIENAAKNKLICGDVPADKNATQKTINLYRNLKKLLHKGIMFGHQDDLAYGVGWKYIPGKSDVKEVTGDYPAVYGFELGRLELGHQKNLDGVPFDKMKRFIQKAYSRGGVITLSWHANNPLTGETAWDPAEGTVASILPGGSKHQFFKSWLNKVADFIVSLKDESGKPIPIIFRPYHELNGNWFWWGKGHCTPGQFKELWHFTISYLRDEKNIHQLLYAFNTGNFDSKEAYLLKYPGDEWADVIGFDIYQREHGAKANNNFLNDLDKMLTMLEEMAMEKNKIPALTEFGYPEVPDSTWWTNVLYKALENHQISYALAWRSAGYKKATGEMEYYIPYKGQVSENDFIKFYNKPNILFQKEVTKATLYNCEKNNRHKRCLKKKE